MPYLSKTLSHQCLHAQPTRQSLTMSDSESNETLDAKDEALCFEYRLKAIIFWCDWMLEKVDGPQNSLDSLRVNKIVCQNAIQQLQDQINNPQYAAVDPDCSLKARKKSFELKLEKLTETEKKLRDAGHQTFVEIMADLESGRIPSEINYSWSK